MLRASLRGLFSRKLRLAMAVIAVMLGTGFLSGAFVLSDTLGARFSSLFESINKNVALQVTLDDAAAEKHPPPRLDQATLDRLQQVDGVSVAAGGANAVGVIPFDVRSGKPVLSSGGPQLGVGVSGDDPFQLIHIAEGRWPTAEGEAAISGYTAKQAHAGVGDRLKVFLPGVNQAREYTVVGVARYSGDRESLAGETMVILPMAQAQQTFFGATGLYSDASLGAEEGVSQRELRDRVAPLLPAGFEAKTGEQANEEMSGEVSDALSGLTTYVLLPFAIIAVVVGIFLIFNTFNIVVAQRARELALMRALGASWGQVTGSVLVEAVLVGVAGSTLGLIGGVALGYAGSTILTNLISLDLPGGVTVGLLPVLLAYLVGVLVTILSALIPAIKASAVPPLAAMRDVVRPDKPLRALSLFGAALAVPGVALMTLGLTGAAGGFTMPLLLLGVGLIFFGVALLSPLLTRPVAGLIGRLVRWGVPGDLGVRNALRNPRRTAVTAAALMIGVTLVSAAGVVGASFKKTIDDTVRSSIGAELFVTTSTNQAPTGESGFAPSAMDKVRAIPGVARTVTLFLTIDAKIDGKSSQSLAFMAVDDMNVTRDLFAMESAGGELRPLADNELIVDENTAKSRGWKVGDKVPIELSRGGERQYTIVGLIAGSPLWANSFILPESAVPNFAGPLANQGYIELEDGADPAAVTAQVERIMSDYPLVTVGDRSSLVDQFNQFIDVALIIIGVLLGLAILIALLGILNTLLLSIYERTRELGMLRAVGLNRTGVMRMIGTESVVMAVFGCLLGIALGVGLGVALSAALIDIDFLTTIAIPWLNLAVFMLVAALAGVVAALWPAARAARLNVLEAIAYE